MSDSVCGTEGTRERRGRFCIFFYRHRVEEGSCVDVLIHFSKSVRGPAIKEHWPV